MTVNAPREDTSLTAFLLARISEDEEVARAAAPGWRGPEWMCCTEGTQSVMADPKHVLAECEAKRLLVAAVEESWARYPRPNWFTQTKWNGDRPYVLRCLALPYADHPDYDAEWRP